MGKTVREAQARAYRAVDMVRWTDGFCRRDIARQAVELEQD
jgi:phosphoribosylamine--glycine ligase